MSGRRVHEQQDREGALRREGSADGVVVITGASSGIGRELARLYAARGRALVLVARRAERLEALREELAGAGAGSIEIEVLDLEQPDAAEALVAAIDARGLTIDVLVNNAGFGLRGSFATLPFAGQVAMLQLNVVTLTQLCRLVLPRLLARKRGGILNVASVAAFQPVPSLSVYAATKAYVLALSEGLHEEVKGTGVVVTALCPGATATEFTVRADMEQSKLFERAMPADAVARLGLAGFDAGRAVVVPGVANRVGAVAVRFVPRAWVRWGAGKLQGDRS